MKREQQRARTHKTRKAASARKQNAKFKDGRGKERARAAREKARKQ